METEYAELFEKAANAVDEMLCEIKLARKSRPIKLYLLITLNDMVRKSHSVRAMLNAKEYGAVDDVARSILESYIDYLNLCKRGIEYADYMQFICDKQWLKQMRENRDSKTSPFAKNLRAAAPKTLGKTIAALCDELVERKRVLSDLLPADYFAGSYVDTGVLKRFKLAGMEHEYNAIYRMLSLSSHGTVGKMAAGVAHREGIMWPPGDLNFPQMSVSFLSKILIDSALRYERIYRKGSVRLKLDSIHKELLRVEGSTSN